MTCREGQRSLFDQKSVRSVRLRKSAICNFKQIGKLNLASVLLLPRS